MLDVTVCILSYNRPAYLREAVNSVLLQTKNPQKIVIYDNGSDDKVFESIEEFLTLGVEWVGADSNHSFIWNFNRAILDSKTEYTMLLHDDDRLCSNFLDTQIKLLNADSSLVAISCNGYLIDDAGKRTGKTLGPVDVNEQIKFYSSSGQVAIKYASNSCVPFSPTIYRSEPVKSVGFRTNFGKVCDAVYFCDLAEIGVIAYQTVPLYECRIHSGQDSKTFPYELMNNLEDFYRSRKCDTDIERIELYGLLRKQRAVRNVKRLFLSLIHFDLLQAVSVLNDSKFSFIDVAKVITVWIFKKFYGS